MEPGERDAEAARHRRVLEGDHVARVRERIAKLNDKLRAAIEGPTSLTVASVIDETRWAKLDVDTALALKGHVGELRDEAWVGLRYADPHSALATFAAFVAADPKSLDLVEMRNLRARIGGLLSVARGYLKTL